MILYAHQSGKLREVKEKPLKLEKDIQKIFENNLVDIMGIEFVKREFTIKNKRIDTLAFDTQARAFIIIEYKRDKNMSVVDQGFSYLSLMLENKAEFIIEYNESKTGKLKRDDVDWSQTRVAFVSTNFTENQILATNFNDIAIELWEVKHFDNDTILINPIKKSKSAESIKPLAQRNKKLQQITSQIKVYNEQDHLSFAGDYIKDLYGKYKSAILNLAEDIEVVPKKTTVAFKKRKSITDVIVQKKALKFVINVKMGQLDDPKRLAVDLQSTGHWGNGDYQVQVSDDRNLEYIMSLIKQAL